MTFLTAEQIRAADDLERKVVEVPEWNGSVLIQAFDGPRRARFEMATYASEDTEAARAEKLELARPALVALSIINEDGTPMFTEADIKSLAKKSGAALERIAEEAFKLSRLGKRDVEAAKKNSDPLRNGDSGSS